MLCNFFKKLLGKPTWVWVAGNDGQGPDAVELIGVFDCQDRAASACTNEDDWYVLMPLNRLYGGTDAMEGVTYPNRFLPE